MCIYSFKSNNILVIAFASDSELVQCGVTWTTVLSHGMYHSLDQNLDNLTKSILKTIITLFVYNHLLSCTKSQMKKKKEKKIAKGVGFPYNTNEYMTIVISH